MVSRVGCPAEGWLRAAGLRGGAAGRCPGGGGGAAGGRLAAGVVCIPGGTLTAVTGPPAVLARVMEGVGRVRDIC